MELGLPEAGSPLGPHQMRMNHMRDGDRTSWQHVRHQLGGRRLDGRHQGGGGRSRRGRAGRGGRSRSHRCHAWCVGEARVVMVTRGMGEVVRAI
jgi:hypothetical protein